MAGGPEQVRGAEEDRHNWPSIDLLGRGGSLGSALPFLLPLLLTLGSRVARIRVPRESEAPSPLPPLALDRDHACQPLITYIQVALAKFEKAHTVPKFRITAPVMECCKLT